MNEPSKVPRGGIVTRIATQRKNPERVSLYVDGEFALGMHRDVLLEHPVSRGTEVTPAMLESMGAADERLRAKKRALDLLAYRARSEDELRRRLGRDGFSESAATGAVERMRDLGYVDDVAFATEYATARFRARGYGRHRLLSELRKRGVAPSIAASAVDGAIGDGEGELENARAFAHKRMGRLSKEPDAYRRRKKLSDALVRRGFGRDIVQRVVDELLS
jgi:regulatory protein